MVPVKTYICPSDPSVSNGLSQTTNGGASWSTGGPIDAAVAASPDAFAADGSHLAALLGDGTVETIFRSCP